MTASFPLRSRPDGRCLQDQAGRPFLYHADTAWMLLLKLGADEAEAYLRARKAQGFNAVQIQLTGFLGATDPAGRLPFGLDHDFARPDENFFAHADEIIARAERLGLLLAVAPLWSGCCGEGWAGKEKDGETLKPLNANGPQKCRDLGRWLGRRYARFANLLWILGGDNDPDNARAEIRELALGLAETAPHQPRTYHAASSHSSTDVWPEGEPWLNVVMVYTYFRGFNKAWNKAQPDVYEVCWTERRKSPARPFFLGESTYEGEHDFWGSAHQIRKQAYWAMLGGATGHAYGSVNWKVEPDWREVIAWPGAQSLRFLRQLFEDRAWHTLVPDEANALVTSGSEPFARNDYAAAAVAFDDFALVYVPSPRPLLCDLSRLAGDKARIRASWFDPTSGETRPAVPDAPGHFPPPGNNVTGDPDWVLVLETTHSR